MGSTRKFRKVNKRRITKRWRRKSQKARRKGRNTRRKGQKTRRKGGEKNIEMRSMRSNPKITYYDNGSIKEKRWYKDGKIHKDDGPAVIKYDPEGNISLEYWYEDGNKLSEYWYKDGKMHKDGGPAKKMYNAAGAVTGERWYKNGKHHRDNGPASTRYYPGKFDKKNEKKIKWEMWYEDDKLNRYDGPAMIDYDLEGNISEEDWYLKDKNLTEEEHAAQVLPRKQKAATLEKLKTMHIVRPRLRGEMPEELVRLTQRFIG